MKSGLFRFMARSGQTKRSATVFIVLTGLLITMCVAYGINGQLRRQGPRTSTQQTTKRGRAIRGKTSSARKGVEACFPPPSGLVSWYRSEGDAKDFTNANVGTANANVTFVPGKVGQAFNFNGTGEVDIPDSASLRPSALSIDGWIRPNFSGRPRITADVDTIFEKLDGAQNGYFLGLTQDSTFTFNGAPGPQPNGTIAFQVNIAGTIFTAFSTVPVPNDTQFHHVAGTYDGIFLRVYLDGNPVGQKTAQNGIVHTTNTAHIGITTSAAIRNSVAAIDEVDIYNRALNDAEVSSIFAAGGSGKCTVNQTPIYFENFEAGAGGYTSNNSAGTFGWTNTTNCGAGLAGHSLTHAFRFGNPAVCNDYGIGVRTAATLVSIPIDLSNKSGTLVLDFRYLLKTDSASVTAPTDVARVDLFEASAGLNFIRTAASNRQDPANPIINLLDAGPSATPTWNDVKIDVSDFANKKLVVEFFFDTIDGANNNFDGWLIDDVQILSDNDVAGDGTELLHQNFERGLQNFTASPTDTLAQWLTSTNCGGVSAGGHSQPTIVRFGTPSTCDYDVPGASPAGTLTSPDIDLTGQSGQVILNFNYYLSTETNATDSLADVATVKISTNNFATFTVLATNRTDLFSNAQLLFDLADPSLPRNFMRSVIDISDFADNHVKIRWEFNTGDELNNALPGFAIDDVRVRSTVNAPTPVIFGVDPNNGSPSGGDKVTVTGFGFAAPGIPNPPLVFFGNNQATGVVVDDDNTLNCFTPPGAVGTTVKVTVITANGQTREDVFFAYNPPPLVSGISPTFGPKDGGTHVTISGVNFDPVGPGGHFVPASGTTVLFGSNPGTNVQVVNDNTITVDSPAGTGIVDVVVSNGNGMSNTGVKFQYFPVIITSVAPTVGPEAGGTDFTVTGFGGPTVQTTGVTFGGKPATNIVINPNTITGKTPSGTGQVPVVVQSNQGPSNELLFTYQPQPLANPVTAVMTTYLAGNLGLVLPNPDVNLPTPTQTVINGIPAGAHPYGVAFTGSDRALISDFGASRIFVVQLSNHTVLSTLDTSPDYDGKGTIAVSPNLTFGLFASGSTLYVKSAPIDAAGPHTTVALPGNVEDFRKQAIAFDINGRAFVYNSTGISVLDAPYTSVAFTIPFANSGGSIAMNSNGNRLLVTDFTDKIKVFPSPFSAATVPTAIVFPGGPHLSGVAINPNSSAALVSEFHTPRLFTMVQPFNPSPQILEDVLPPGLASSPFGFSDLAMSADGQFAIGTGNDASDTHQPAAFIEAPFDNPRIFAVDITGPGRGDGVARFLPSGLAPGLTITKSAPSTVPSLGNMTYTLTYTNTGAVVIPDVQIKDTFPAGTTFVSAANGGANNFGTVAWNVGNVAPNASGTVSFTVNVTASQGATITNSSYSASGDVGSPVTGPPVTTTVTAPVAGPDLSIQKTHSGNFTIGLDGFYTINVTNVGSSSTTGAITVTDVLPTGLTFVSNVGTGSCSAVSQTVTCLMNGPLTANQSESVTIRVTVASAAFPSVTNTATVSTTGDANSANDSSSDPTTVNKSADVAIDDFSVSSNSVPVGTNVTYTIGVTNNGPSPATGVTLTSPLPSNVTFVSGNFSQGSCSATTTLITCALGNTASGAATITGTIVVKPTAGPSFQAVVNLSGNEPDPNSGNNSASTTIGVTTSPDLAITKSHSGNFTVGIDGFYTINLSNVGSASTTGGITVTDTLPAGLTFISNTGSGSCSAVGQTVTCAMFNPLTGGQSEAVSIRVAVGVAAFPSVTNVATVATPGDTNSGNDSSSDPTTVKGSADLALSLSVAPNPVVAGNNLTYTIGMTNNGPTATSGVTVTAPIPAGTFVSANATQGTCSLNTTIVTCGIGNMSVSQNVGVTIVIRPTSGPFPATAAVSGNDNDPNTGNNSSSVTVVVTPPPAPVVSSINPQTGAEAGGTSVTITGNNFTAFNAGTTSVTFGGTLATSVVVVNNTTITCNTPAGLGQVRVIVSNNNGTSNNTIIFTYTPPPLANANPAILTTISAGNLAIVLPRPDLNLPTPTQNNVTGPANGVAPQGVAYFGSDSALVSDFFNSRIFVVRISTATVLDTISTTGKFDGTGTIAVAPSLNFALASGNTFSLAVVKAPFNASSQVTTVPLPGTIRSFQTEAISFDSTGRAFVYTTAGISVLDAPYTSVAFTIPVSNSAGGALAITPNGQTLLVTGFSNSVAIFNAPFSANSVPTVLPISGVSSLDGIAVAPDGNTALVADSFVAKVFAIAAPFSGGSAVQSLVMPPTIGSGGFEDIGFSADSQMAIITGNDISGAPALFIRGPFTSSGARTFAVAPNGGGRGAGAVRFLPPGLAPGLTISKTAPASVASNANYSYTISYANTGQTNVANVIIKDPLPSGTSFVSASNGGTFANGVVTWSIGNLNAGASGTLTLTVTATATSGNIVNANYTIEGTGFTPVAGPPVTTATLNNQPVVSSVSPNVGATAGGTAVVISGQNFQAQGAGTNTVKFGSASATNVVVVNDQTITAVTPAGTGTVPVTVVNGNGTSNNTVTFTYSAVQLNLAVSEVSPAQAPEAGGTPVKIFGVGFGTGNSSTTAVLFGGKPATGVIVVSDTEVDATVPAGTGVVNVSVSNNLGSSTLVGGFTYLKPLAQNVLIDWHAPNDPTKQLAPPRDVATEFTTTPPNGGGGGITQTIQEIVSQRSQAQAGTSADPTTFVVAYNVFRGFTPDFDVTGGNQGGAEGAEVQATGVTMIGTTPANQLSIVDSAAALAAAQANGFGTPFYKVTAVYQTPTGLQSSQASNVAAPLPTVTVVSVVNSGTGTGKIIRIDGVGFASFRAILEINGTQFTTLNFPPAQRLENGSTGRIELQDNTGNLIPIGAQVSITVLNPGLTAGSGTRSQVFIFRRLN